MTSQVMSSPPSAKRHWNLVQANRPLQAVLAWLWAPRPVPARVNVMRDAFDPAGLRPWVTNLDVIGPASSRVLHREGSRSGRVPL